MSATEEGACPHSELAAVYVVHALAAGERTAFEAHAGHCPRCRRELDMLGPVVEAFAAWPVDVLRPAPSLQRRLARRIGMETGASPEVPAGPQWTEPAWEEVAPGISCKILSDDAGTHMVSMLVRLAPGAAYPPHTHAGVEELHLLEGELWIDDRKLFPGDYNRALPGTGDKRVWSETGCTCVLVTSARDQLL